MVYRFKIPVYFGTFAVVIAKTIKEGGKEIGENIKDGTDDDYAAITLSNGLHSYSVIIKEDGLDRFGDIAHECKHFVNFLFIDRGIKLDAENDEPECYMLGWAVDRFHEAIKKHRKCAT